jgi:D-alanyl-D-alanine-carboxypeptidase/D-alanyl-D-alanine-endopeptidase
MLFRLFACCSLSLTILVGWSLASLRTQNPTAGGQPSDAEIRGLLQERLDPNAGTGIIVGLADGKGTHIIAVGKTGTAGATTLDGTTVFEIGSATKVFTATLLAEMAARGEVRLDDPVAKYLPESVRIPGRNGRQITLLDLVTHTSGLPRPKTSEV